MALTKQKKEEIVNDLAALLAEAKMTVVAKYEGTTVKTMQEMRRSAEADGTVLKVVKNRLVIKALQANDAYKDSDVSELKGMLLYAINKTDEVSPAKVIHEMAKTQKQIEFIGAYNDSGAFLSAEDVKALAQLPTREEMISTLVHTLKSPVNNVMSGLAGNIHGLLDAVAAKNA